MDIQNSEYIKKDIDVLYKTRIIIMNKTAITSHLVSLNLPSAVKVDVGVEVAVVE